MWPVSGLVRAPVGLLTRRVIAVLLAVRAAAGLAPCGVVGGGVHELDQLGAHRGLLGGGRRARSPTPLAVRLRSGNSAARRAVSGLQARCKRPARSWRS